jgi:TRAP-type C4-dicarboxylate transport system substrate-binding protein
MRGRLLGFAFSAATLLASSRADAWYFPEHVVLMGDGHATLAPEVRDIIGEAVAAARAEGFKLCEGTERTLEDVLTQSPLVTAMVRTPASAPCVP